jgi:hypothetical protein
VLRERIEALSVSVGNGVEADRPPRSGGHQCHGTFFAEGELDRFTRGQLALLEFDAQDVRDFGDLVRPLIEDERAKEDGHARHIKRDLALIDDRL